jgi:hypothetical protein
MVVKSVGLNSTVLKYTEVQLIIFVVLSRGKAFWFFFKKNTY